MERGCMPRADSRVKRCCISIYREYVLWKPPPFFHFGLSSPDGRHLATRGSTPKSNIWMLESF